MATRRMTAPLPLAGAPPAERSDAAENRRRILAAARVLLAERGPGGLSMDAVAVRAGVGKGTVFRRFGDRSGLTSALLDEDMRRLQDAFLSGPPPLGPGTSPGARIAAFLVELVRMQGGDLPVALVAQADGAFASPVNIGPLHVHLRVLLAELDPQMDAHVVAALLLGAVAPPVLAGLLGTGGEGTEAVVAAVVRLLDGITSPGDAAAFAAG